MTEALEVTDEKTKTSHVSRASTSGITKGEKDESIKAVTKNLQRVEVRNDVSGIIKTLSRKQSV